jgi:hypothetical protein
MLPQLLDTNGMPRFSDTNGDSMLWAGLMVAVGDSRPIKGIKMCQSEDGRLWRAPDRVNNQAQNGFSRDMSLGFILYVQATGDYEMADKWVAYIKKTRGLFPANESSDNRYVVTPGLWWTMSYAGIKVPLIYRLTRFLLRPYSNLELMFTKRGYQVHLKGVISLILAIRDKKRDTKFGQKLLDIEPENPFYMWLAGKTSDALLRSAYLEYVHNQNPGECTQWAWQRADEEEAWRDACGWDFLFIRMLCKMSI